MLGVILIFGPMLGLLILVWYIDHNKRLKNNWKQEREDRLKEKWQWRVYLAAPYSHPNEKVREARAQVINQKCAKLMGEHNVVFSPITHSHALIDIHPFEERTWPFFRIQDFSHIETCHELRVFCLPGWEESRGVKEEIEYARLMGKKIVYDNYEGKLLHQTFENDGANFTAEIDRLQHRVVAKGEEPCQK